MRPGRRGDERDQLLRRHRSPCSNSMPVYMPSVFSRTTTRSTSSYTRGHARIQAARPDVRVQVELLAQRQVHAARAALGGRLDRTLERHAGRADRRERGSGAAASRRPANGRRAHLADVPFDLDPVASIARRAASMTSGPMPSPGIRVHAARLVRLIRAGSLAVRERRGYPGDRAATTLYRVEAGHDARRASGRSSPRETKISDIDGEAGRLWYAGYEIGDLADTRLVRGDRCSSSTTLDLPNREQLDELNEFLVASASSIPFLLEADARPWPSKPRRCRCSARVSRPRARTTPTAGTTPPRPSTARRCG